MTSQVLQPKSVNKRYRGITRLAVSIVTSAPTILRPKHKIDACLNKFVVEIEIEIETVIVVGMRKGTYFKNTVNGCCSK